MASNSEQIRSISRRDAIRRVSLLLGGVAFVGGSRLLAALEKTDRPAGSTVGEFSAQDIAFLDEIAETILPETKTPGAKAAKTGAFMALMVTDSYWPDFDADELDRAFEWYRTRERRFGRTSAQVAKGR